SVYVEDTGCIQSTAGILSITTDQLILRGVATTVVTNTDIFGFPVTTTLTSGPKLSADADIEVHAQVMTLSNALLKAGILLQGSVILDVSDRLVDGGQSGINQ